jgi:hypothetical protein
MGPALEFAGQVWLGLTEALRLNPRLFAIVETYPRSVWVVLTIALIGGAGLMVGQAVILFVNRVSPVRFLFSLGLNAVTFALGLAFWAASIWLISRIVLQVHVPLTVTLRLVALGAAPYVFGPLILMPYAGAAIGKLLSVWSALVVVSAVSTILAGSVGGALVAVGLGWLLVEIGRGTIGRPIVAVHDWLWRRVTGSSLDVRVHDILAGQADIPRVSDSGSRR